MGDAGIFLIQGEGNERTLAVLRQKPFDSEELLQEALAKFPDVLAGGTTVGGEGRPLLLVSREMGVPKAEGAPATWSADHLFLDQEGVPVVVEVKRATDTRIRREVVGQMLDYAANGVRYWPADLLRDRVSAASGGEGDPDAVTAAFGIEDVDAYWRQVEANLAIGRIRMVFVADRLPPELVRIIEFLNEQMRPAEVLGVQVPQYVADGHQVLVPELVGRTRASVVSRPPDKWWNSESFLQRAAGGLDAPIAAMFSTLFEHAAQHGARLSFGKGASPGVSAWYPLAGAEQRPTWYGSAGTAKSPPVPLFSLYLGSIRAEVDDDRFAKFAADLAKTKLLADLASSPAKELYIDVPELAEDPGEVEAILAAIELLLTP